MNATDKTIAKANLFSRLFDGVEPFLSHQVCRHRVGMGGQFARQLFQTVGTPRDQDQVVTARCQSAGEGLADAAGSAGYQRDGPWVHDLKNTALC